MLPEAKCGRGAQNPRDRKSKTRPPPDKQRENPVTNRTTYSIIKDMPAPAYRGGAQPGNRNKYDDTE